MNLVVGIVLFFISLTNSINAMSKNLSSVSLGLKCKLEPFRDKTQLCSQIQQQQLRQMFLPYLDLESYQFNKQSNVK